MKESEKDDKLRISVVTQCHTTFYVLVIERPVGELISSFVPLSLVYEYLQYSKVRDDVIILLLSIVK